MEHTAQRQGSALHEKTRLLVMTALFTALGYVATRVLMVPAPTGGYVNLGDAVVLLGAFLLGPAYGALAGGLGPALADLLSGYPAWVPGTLVIKALMGLTAALIYRGTGKKPWSAAVAGVAAEIIMVTGYWLYDGLFIVKSLLGGAAGIPGNVVQGAFGMAVSTLLVLALRRSGYVRKLFPGI